MKIRILRILVVAIIVFCLVGIGTVSADTIYVPDDYSTIQEAIDNAIAGNTIIVSDGTYHENVNIDKQLIIESENGSANCIVDAGGSGSAITLSADGITFEGFNVINSNNAGIKVYSNSNNITNNRVSKNSDGIYLYYSNGNNITNNNISSNNNFGIFLKSSRNNNITYNIGSNNGEYLILSSSNNNTVTKNTVSNNGFGIDLSNSNNNILTNNRISNNDGGLSLHNSNNSIVTNNEISNNYFGLFLYYSKDSIISSNNISSNNWSGIYLEESSNNTFYLNNFINNKNNVNSYLPEVNIWNSTEKITYAYNGSTFSNYLGNYWSDYAGPDTSLEDGIGDTPYSIDGSNDNYPLMQTFESYFMEINPYDTNNDCCMSMGELFAAIEDWKKGDLEMGPLFEVIELWKKGEYC